jgi:hypothetical protein
VHKQNESDSDHIIENSQFSLAVGLLTILTFLILFAYISNILRKRWRNRITLINCKLILLSSLLLITIKKSNFMITIY